IVNDKLYAGLASSGAKPAYNLSQLNFSLYYLKKSALILMKCFHSSGVADSSKIAVTGHAGSQAPQSIHSSGLIKSCSLSSNPSSPCEGWMQSTGQTSTQDASFTPIHGWVI